jgi:hypothetical protein
MKKGDKSAFSLGQQENRIFNFKSLTEEMGMHNTGTPHNNVSFEILKPVTMKVTVLWDVTPCSLVDLYPSFGGTYCHHFQGRIKKQAPPKKSVSIYQTARLHIPENINLHLITNLFRICGYHSGGMKSSIFWDTTQCSPLKVKRRFREICRLHLQGKRISQARNQHDAGNRQTAT